MVNISLIYFKTFKSFIMNVDNIKVAIDNFGRNNYSPDTVIEVVNGNIKLKNVTHMTSNQISLIGCVFDFSRNFNENSIQSILPELNSLIEISKTHNLLEL